MEQKPRNLGRAYLVAELMKRRATRRIALWIMNQTLREMSHALARGEEVALPGRKLKRVRCDSIRYMQLIDDWSLIRA
jgi:hypothetical protein